MSDIKNGMPFNKAAATYSAAADALKGGELSWKTLDELPDSFQVVSKMNKGQISKLIRTPGGFSIIKLLNKREQKKSVNYTDKYHIKQIVIDITPVTTSLDAKARLLRIRDSLIHSKESFKNLAKANSDDHISSNKGGQLEWVSSNQLNAINPKMAETAAQLKLNEVSEPFKVNNKWYLIKLVGKKKVDNSKELQEQHAQQMLFQKKPCQL